MSDPAAHDEREPALPHDRDAAYRQHVATVLLAHVNKNGSLSNAEAYRQVAAVTERSLGTVKNWLTYRTIFPDLGSMARMVSHWHIPPESLLPPHLDELLSGTPDAAPGEGLSRATSPDQTLLSFHGPNDPAAADRALAKYTDHPRAAIFVRHEGSDMPEQVRPGELLLIDPSCEQIRGGGLYLLRFSVEGQADKTAVRRVELLMSEPAVRVSGGSASDGLVETLPLRDGALPAHIAVLGRVIGVLRGA